MYSQALFLLTGLSIAAATLSQEPSHQSPPTEWMLVSTTTVNETIVLTCPPAPTVWVSVTQYVQETTTTTDTDFETDTTTTSIWTTTTLPITIYQTIISTTTLTTVSQFPYSPIQDGKGIVGESRSCLNWELFRFPSF